MIGIVGRDHAQIRAVKATPNRALIAGAATAFTIQTAALTAGALWAGWQLHRWSATLAATTHTTHQPAQPQHNTLHVVTDPTPGDPPPTPTRRPMA